MGCFSVQKPKKKVGEQTVKLDEVGDGQEVQSPSPLPRPVLSAPPSFKRTVRAIQNAQRFIIHSNPKLRSLHPSYGSIESRHSTSDQRFSLSDVATHSKPMPLPSPSLQPSPKPSGYVLPHPTDHVNGVSTSPKAHNVNGKQTSTGSVGHGALKGRVFPWDLQPLPPPKEAMATALGLKSFAFEDLSSACQQFSPHSSVGDDNISYAGTIKVSAKGDKEQEVLIIRLHEKSHLGLKEWMSELSTITRLHASHLCKLVGFYAEDGKSERFLVYEKLQKGSLHSLMFEASDSPPLDWPTRMKIAHGAAQGLASLHEKCPEQMLYKDFRLSHIQVDADYSSKLLGYCFFGSSNDQSLQAQDSNSSSNARANAYCAPEMLNGGVITLKSNVWSFGVVLLELLSGRKNLDERITKVEKQNLVKWAKPFLIEEERLFLIMDPKLQGRFPSKGAKIIADLVLQCLENDPTRRPTMKVALNMVKSVQEMRYTTRFPLKEPSNNAVNMPAMSSLRNLAPSSSFKTGILDRERPSYIRSPTKFDLIENPPLKPLIIPRRSCATSFAREELGHHHQQDYSSAPLGRVKDF